MNRKQLRARKAFERKHATQIAKQCAAVCFDLDAEGKYVQITNPTAVQTLRKGFERHLRLQDDITFMRLTDAQSAAFPVSGEIAIGTVSVMAVTRANNGELAFAIERCSGGLGDEHELLEAARCAVQQQRFLPNWATGNSLSSHIWSTSWHTLSMHRALTGSNHCGNLHAGIDLS